MQVQINKEVKETVNVEPGYYRGRLLSDVFLYLHLTGTLIYVSADMTWIITPNRRNYGKEIQELVTDYIPCKQAEFEAAKDKSLAHLNNYISFPEVATQVNPAQGGRINMFDPNTQQPDELKNAEANEQATEQVAPAGEAVGDSEEGSIEG